jgi:hypothetical protein
MSLSTRSSFLLLTTLALLLYAPFLAIQYDTNGMVEAQSMERGILLPHNHMVYRPIGFVLYSMVKQLGYSGNSLPVFQGFNAVCGALSVGLCYVAFTRLMLRPITAAVASLWWGTTLITWYISTDATYMALASTFAAAALAVTAGGSERRHAVWSGVLAALCVFTWQAGVFLIPGLLAIWWLKKDRQAMWTLLAVSGGLIFVVYLLVGLVFFSVSSTTDFLRWILMYGSAGTLPMWGQWSLERIPMALASAFRSFVATPLMVNPMELFDRQVQLGRLAIDITVVAITALLVGGVVRIATERDGTKRGLAAALLVGYLAFLPFIAWWDPWQSMWWVVPNIYLAGLLGAAWDISTLTSRPLLLFAAITAGMALTNFVTIVRPRHTQLGQDRAIAQCFAEHTTGRDLFLSAEWGWPDYLEYLHQRNVLSLIGSSHPFSTKSEHLEVVRMWISETQQAGGSVFMHDPGQFSSDHMQWLTSQTRLELDDLQSFTSQAAFSCAGQVIRKVE